MTQQQARRRDPHSPPLKGAPPAPATDPGLPRPRVPPLLWFLSLPGFPFMVPAAGIHRKAGVPPPRIPLQLWALDRPWARKPHIPSVHHFPVFRE